MMVSSTVLPRLGRRLGLAALGLLLGACGPSYTHARIAPDLRELCQRDYKIPVHAQLVGHDITVTCSIPGLLKSSDGQVEFSPTQEANTKLGNVIEAIHRVVLSADWPVDFYAVVATDPGVDGAWLMLIRSLDDVRRVYANAISPNEFFRRTVLNLEYDPLHPPDLHNTYLHDMTMENFLVLQLSKRLQNLFKADPDVSSAYDVGPCAGEYRQGAFQFVLTLAPREGTFWSEEEAESLFDQAFRLTASVLHDYHFEHFNEVQMLHFPSGKTMGVPKIQLWSFLSR